MLKLKKHLNLLDKIKVRKKPWNIEEKIRVK